MEGSLIRQGRLSRLAYVYLVSSLAVMEGSAFVDGGRRGRAFNSDRIWPCESAVLLRELLVT